MNKTKIDWCDSTWNPVTGCLHKCEYCYARGIARRFGGASETHYNECVGGECQWVTEGTGKIHELDEPVYDVDRGHNAPYPFEFDPTLYRYRLDIPSRWKNPRNIFVCSMADLFGEWVPDEWIQAVFKACEAAPQHRYLFLTKNPSGLKYPFYQYFNHNPNWWVGTSIAGTNDSGRAYDLLAETSRKAKKFLSVEPLQNELDFEQFILKEYKWVIIGAETGNRKGKVIPKREWIDAIVNQCRASCVPVFMKESLRKMMGNDFVQEFPWEATP